MITFEKARIVGVEHKIGNGTVTAKIKISAMFTAKSAQDLNAKWVLFNQEALVKDGFKSVELDAELKNIGVHFDVPKLGKPLDLTSEGANSFKVLRQGDGKKKAKKLVVQFKIHHSGSPFELLEHVIRVAGAEGRLILTPLQQEMEFFRSSLLTASAPQSDSLPAAPVKNGKKRRRPSKAVREANAEAAMVDHNSRVCGVAPIPTDPGVPEWRNSEDIAEGVPHHILPKCQ